MRYLDLPEDCSHVKIYDLFPTRDDYLKFCKYASEVVCARMYLDPEHHEVLVHASIQVYPTFEPPFVKDEKK